MASLNVIDVWDLTSDDKELLSLLNAQRGLLCDYAKTDDEQFRVHNQAKVWAPQP